MAVRKLNNGRWKAEPYYNKKLPSKTFATESEALAYEYRVVQEAKGKTFQLKEIPLECFTFKNLIDYCKMVFEDDVEKAVLTRETVDRYNRKLVATQRCTKLYEKPVRNLTPDDIDYLIDFWWTLPKSKTRLSYEMEFKTLNLIFSIYKDRKRDQYFHSPILKSHRKKCFPTDFERRKRGAISKEDINKWLTSLKNYSNDIYHDLAYIMIHLGLRKGEALGIEWKHIDVKNMSIRIEQQVIYRGKEKTPIVKPSLKTKTSNRTVAMSEGCLRIFKKLYARKQLGLLFWDGKNDIILDSNIYHVFNTCFKRAGLDKTGTHVCRRTFISLGSSQHSLEALQKAAGHKTRDMTEHYLDYSVHDLTNVSQSVEDLLRQKTSTR
jgi:integrase